MASLADDYLPTELVAAALTTALAEIMVKEMEGAGLTLPGTRRGGSIASFAAGFAKKLIPTIAKLASKILGTLGLAAASRAISGSTQRAMTRSGSRSRRSVGAAICEANS
ncbi:MAG: hypothetical protein AB2556_23450 [Candidatus Thiodiazotropha sp.]